MNAIEKQIARHMAAAIIQAGHNISVDYGRGYDCEAENFALKDVDKIIEASDAVDECHWMLDAERDGEGAQAQEGYLYFIWGNGDDGRTCLSDYTMNLEPLLEPINKWADEAKMVLEGEPGKKFDPHYDDEGYLRTARHEGKTAAYSGKKAEDCPYGPPEGDTARSWLKGHADAFVVPDWVKAQWELAGLVHSVRLPDGHVVEHLTQETVDVYVELRGGEQVA